jgi:predicted AAA+ superfamily ATPase
VGLIGSRQAGKTTLAKALVTQRGEGAVYLDLERPSDLLKLNEAELYLESLAGRCVVLDEIQRKPDLFPLLRAVVDDRAAPGQFLILGSAAPALRRQSSESLAGRIAYHELTPIQWREIAATPDNAANDTATIRQEMERLWRRGGYPNALLAEDEATSWQWRNNFIETHLDRDIPQLGYRVSAAALYRFWLMLAHVHGNLWDASNIARGLGVSARTTGHYLDVLEDTFMVRRLPPCFRNLKKRLVKSSKVYLRDSGLLHAMLRIPDQETLTVHPAVGASWEGWVIEQVIGLVPDHWMCSFYRTAAGAEMDLVIEPVQGLPPIAVEIKYSAAPKTTKGFWSAVADLQPRRTFVVYPGNEFYPIDQNIFALPAHELHRIPAAI